MLNLLLQRPCTNSSKQRKGTGSNLYWKKQTLSKYVKYKLEGFKNKLNILDFFKISIVHNY